MSSPRVFIGPRTSAFAVEAVEAGGGVSVDLDDTPDAIAWLDPRDVEGLRDAMGKVPSVRWVQLPFAGIDVFAGAGLLDDRRVWTSAKGAYAEPVAEHALMLALAGLRILPVRVNARSWGEMAATSLFDAPVTILGGGGITRVLLDLLAPFRSRATVVRRNPAPIEGAVRVVGPDSLMEVLPGAQVVFLALALTPQTFHIIGAEQLAAMDATAWLVNVARGSHVDTDALVTALATGQIAGAALDVTDPEPLTDGHPLWGMENCIITPHTADTPEMVRPLLAGRIRRNVGHFLCGEPMEGVVDPAAGY